jgi:hypothetical protein
MQDGFAQSAAPVTIHLFRAATSAPARRHHSHLTMTLISNLFTSLSFRKSGASKTEQQQESKISRQPETLVSTESSTFETLSSGKTDHQSDLKFWQNLLSKLLTEIVGDREVGEWTIHGSIVNQKMKFILDTEDPVVEIAWAYVQNLWNGMQKDIK